MTYEYMTGLGSNGDIDRPDMDFATPEDLARLEAEERARSAQQVQAVQGGGGGESIYSGIANLFSGLAQQFGSQTEAQITGTTPGAPSGKQTGGVAPAGTPPAPSGKGAPTTTTTTPTPAPSAAEEEESAATPAAPVAAPLVVQPQRSLVPYIVGGVLIFAFAGVGIWLLVRKKD